MSTEFADNAYAQIRDVISCLQSPLPDYPTLRALLCAPLASIGLLSPALIRYNVSPIAEGAVSVPKHIPPLQRALLEKVIPTWEPVLVEHDEFALVQQYFCPDAFSFASPAAGEVAAQAYSTILSLPITEHSVRLLVQLSRSYPIDVLRSVVYSHGRNGSASNHFITWEDCMRNVAAVPGRVANALNGKDIPSDLEHGVYFSNVSVRCELLIASLAQSASRDELSSIAYLLTKLVNIGVFPPSVPSSPSQPSFFQATLPTIRSRVATLPMYTSLWPQVISAIPSTLTLQAILISLISHLTPIDDLDPSAKTRARVKAEAILLCGILGTSAKDRTDLWNAASAIFLSRDWNIGHARIFACWAAGAEKGRIDKEALETLLNRIVDTWTNPEHVKHSLLFQHRYLTAFLLITLSHFPHSAPGDRSSPITSLALSPSFITAISTYISHLDQAVRRCGMLVAEEVAHRAGKALDFGDWEGEQDGKGWCRRVRELIKQRDVDVDVEIAADIGVSNDVDVTDTDVAPVHVAESPASPRTTVHKHKISPVQAGGYDSDDSMTGYASSPSSSRSPSPTPSELDEIEKDPTLRVGKPKIARPVYLAQLGEMVRPTSGVRSEVEQEEVVRIQVALDVAEELIRRKRDYGTELEENAVNLVYGFVGLQDNYEIEGFDRKRQAAVTALIACCPRKAAPAAIEEFFKNQYSTDQRYVILNALALGARELASLPLPPSTLPPQAQKRISFPSKRLPPALHQKYLIAGDQLTAAGQVQNLLEGISKEAIDKGRDVAADKVPEIVRERQLRIRPPAKVTPVTPASALRPATAQVRPSRATTFTEVAGEYFICPLINRFWAFLRDEQMREARMAHHENALHRYRGAGTGLILNALVLSHFVGTLAVLVHAARNAKEWLGVIAPDALELAVTLGTRPVSLFEGADEDDDDEAGGSGGKKQEKEAAVLTSSLELAVIVVDGCLDLDGGRSLGLEHTTLVLGAGEWAAEVLSKLEKGTQVLGGGGTQEMKLRRAAAGLVLKLDELTSRWKRSMIDMAVGPVG